MSDKEPSESEELIKVEKLTPNSREVKATLRITNGYVNLFRGV